MGHHINKRLKHQLMCEYPHCYACDCRLTEDPGLPNSAHIVRKCLSCPMHVKAVRKLGKFGAMDAVFILTEKGKAFLQERNLQQFWFVDGIEYDCPKRAERAAVTLSRLLGCRIDILAGRDRSTSRIVEVVRPGNDARFREESFHADRTKTVEFACV